MRNCNTIAYVKFVDAISEPDYLADALLAEDCAYGRRTRR